MRTITFTTASVDFLIKALPGFLKEGSILPNLDSMVVRSRWAALDLVEVRLPKSILEKSPATGFENLDFRFYENIIGTHQIQFLRFVNLRFGNVEFLKVVNSNFVFEIN